VRLIPLQRFPEMRYTFAVTIIFIALRNELFRHEFFFCIKLPALRRVAEQVAPAVRSGSIRMG